MAKNPFTDITPDDFFSPASETPWRPKIRTGYLWIDGRQHYLYSKKNILSLEEASWTFFDLAALPINSSSIVLPPSLKVEGIPYDKFEIHGQQLRVQHLQPADFATFWPVTAYNTSRWGSNETVFGFRPDNEITISYQTLQWNSTTKTFTSVSVVQHLRFADGERHYFLPTSPRDGAPVVITDDSIDYHDNRDFAVEFSVDPDDQEILFNSKQNLISNPSFEDTPLTDPEDALDWFLSTNATRRRSLAYHGQHSLAVHGTGGYGLQTVEIDPLRTYSLCAKSRGRSVVASGELVVNFVNPSGDIFDQNGVLVGHQNDPSIRVVSTGVAAPSGVWTDIDLLIGEQVDPYRAPDSAFPTGVAIDKVDVYLKSATGIVEFDAVSLTETPFCPQFAFVDPFSTVEYEDSANGSHVFDPTTLGPFEIGDVDLNSLYSDNRYLGFLCENEFSDRGDFGLGKGGPSFTLQPTGQFAIFLDTGVPPTGIIDTEILEIHHEQTFDAWPTGVHLVHIDVGTEFTGASGSWQTSLQSLASTGVFDNSSVDGIAFHGVRELLEATNQDVSFANETLALVRAAATGQKSDAVFALFDGWRVLGTGQYTQASEIAAWVSYLGVEGLSRDRDLHRNTSIERQFILRRTLETAGFIWDNRVSDLTLLALDFEDQDFGGQTAPDFYSRSEFRDFANSRGFKHYVGPTGLLDVFDQPSETYTPLGVVPTWGTGILPQEYVGRKHLPYAQTKGRQKLRERANFHILNETVEVEPFTPNDPIVPKTISLTPLNDFYRDDSKDIHLVVNQQGTGQWVADVLDGNGNPVNRYPFNTSAATGLVPDSQVYSTQQGRIYGTYESGPQATGVGVDRIYVISRLGELGTSMLVDIVP